MIQHTADNSKKDTQEQITEAQRTDQLERVVPPPSPENANENLEHIPINLEQCMDLLEQLEQLCTILIEGPPGIGKSEILTEISYQWAKYKVLKNCKFLFLLNLTFMIHKYNTHKIFQIFLASYNPRKCSGKK